MITLLPMFWVGVPVNLMPPTVEVEIVDNDDVFIVDNDDAQLIDN